MKRIFLSILIVCSAALYAKTVKSYYPDGYLKSVITYKDGRKSGAERIYYDDGATLKYSRNYMFGKLHGLQQSYDKNAMVIAEESYMHGRLHGKSRFYKGGLLYKEIEYRNGQLDGEYREYYPAGIVKTMIKYRRGKAVEGYSSDESGTRKALSKKEAEAITASLKRK